MRAGMRTHRWGCSMLNAQQSIPASRCERDLAVCSATCGALVSMQQQASSRQSTGDEDSGTEADKTHTPSSGRTQEQMAQVGIGSREPAENRAAHIYGIPYCTTWCSACVQVMPRSLVKVNLWTAFVAGCGGGAQGLPAALPEVQL